MDMVSSSSAMTKEQFESFSLVLSGLSDKQLKLVLSNSNLTESEMVKALTIDGTTEAEARQKLATLGITQANQPAAVSTFSFNGSMKALFATISANPVMVLTMAFTALVSIYQKVQREQEEARQNAVESAEKYEEQAASLANLRQEYINIVDSESDVSKKTEELNKWKETLIETYGFEKEAIEKVNLEREKGLSLLDDEITKNRINWLLSAAHTAYDGLADYQDDLWKYEEEVYKGRKQLADDFYDEQQKDFEDRISSLEDDIEITTKYSTDSDGNKLNVEEKYDYISSAYQEIINELNSRIGEILDAGIEGHEEDVAKLEQQIIEYQEKLAEVNKTAAEEEQTYIKKLKDDYSDLYDERIKKIKEQQDAAEKAAQAEIDAVQEKIDALKDANDKEQEALDIEKARKELENASQSTRQVYGADGSISFKADEKKGQGSTGKS